MVCKTTEELRGSTHDLCIIRLGAQGTSNWGKCIHALPQDWGRSRDWGVKTMAQLHSLPLIPGGDPVIYQRSAIGAIPILEIARRNR